MNRKIGFILFFAALLVLPIYVVSCSSDDEKTTDTLSGVDATTGDVNESTDTTTTEDATTGEDNGQNSGGEITENVIAIIDGTPADSAGIQLFDVTKDSATYTLPNTIIDDGYSKWPKYEKLIWNKDRSKLIALGKSDKNCDNNTKMLVDFLNPKDGTVIKSLTINTNVICGTSHYTISPDETTLYFNNQIDGPFKVELKDGATPEKFANITVQTFGGLVGSMHMSPDGTKFVVVGANSSVYIVGTDETIIKDNLCKTNKVCGNGARWLDNNTIVVAGFDSYIKFNISDETKEEIKSGGCTKDFALSVDGNKAICKNSITDFTTATTKKLSFHEYSFVVWNSL